jgi:3D (Asp-Asp-Asp) domain-containing protein
MIAVDNSLIDRGTQIVISTLPEPWNEIIFLSADEGPSIKGKHIDMFTGEGKLAENETFRITSENNKVCK